MPALAVDLIPELEQPDMPGLSGFQARFRLARGVPAHIRSDNGSEFTARRIRLWLGQLGVKTLFIGQGSPWENDYIESFKGKLRDELLDHEIF